MDYIVLFRNTGNGKIGFLSEEEPDMIAVFKNYEDAINAAFRAPITMAFPYQIVQIDEI